MSENINDLLASYFPNFTYDYSNKYSDESFLPKPSLARMVFGRSRLYWLILGRIDAFGYRLDELRSEVYKRRSYGNELPEENKSVYERNLKTIVAIAKSRGIKVILGTQPLEKSNEFWDRHMRYKKYNDVAIYPTHNEFIIHHRSFNDILRNVAKETGAVLVDNERIFDGNREFFIDFVHYTKAGVEKIATDYYNTIVSNNIIQ